MSLPSRTAITTELLAFCWCSYCFSTATLPRSPPVCSASSNTYAPNGPCATHTQSQAPFPTCMTNAAL